MTRGASVRVRSRVRFAHRVLWPLVVVWATALPASSRPSVSDESCPYLRLSLSTPQRVLKSVDDAALQREFLGVLGFHLERAGFEVRGPAASGFAWELFSQVEPLGEGRIAWSYALLPMPGLADGVIEFPTFSLIDRPSGERVQFTTYHGLEHFRISNFPLRAALASEKLAGLYLPAALKLCAERGSIQQMEEARLERIRKELSAEIQRVVAERTEQTKHLELQAEDDEPSESPGD
jgi:hypothetical protein